MLKSIDWGTVLETAVGFVVASLLLSAVLALLGFTSTEEIAANLRDGDDGTMRA